MECRPMHGTLAHMARITDPKIAIISMKVHIDRWKLLSALLTTSCWLLVRRCSQNLRRQQKTMPYFAVTLAWSKRALAIHQLTDCNSWTVIRCELLGKKREELEIQRIQEGQVKVTGSRKISKGYVALYFSNVWIQFSPRCSPKHHVM